MCPKWTKVVVIKQTIRLKLILNSSRGGILRGEWAILCFISNSTQDARLQNSIRLWISKRYPDLPFLNSTPLTKSHQKQVVYCIMANNHGWMVTINGIQT